MSDDSSGRPTGSTEPAPAPQIPASEATTPPYGSPPPPAPPIPSGGNGRNGRRRSTGGGVFLGVLLVVLGAVFLVGQLAPGLHVAWWALWPLIIVVAGVVQMFTPGEEGWGVRRVFEGLGTIIFGLVLLGCTTGYISWSVWWTLLTFWPALVIALGLAILAEGLGQGWLRILATLIVWLALAYAVALSWTGATAVPAVGVWTTSVGTPYSYAEPVGGATKATLDLKYGAGDIAVTDGDRLVSVKGSSPYGAPSFSAKRRGNVVDVGIGVGQPSSGVVIIPGVTSSRMRVALSNDVLWDAELETGASSVDADFSHVRVRNAEVRTGASSVVIRLGPVPSGVNTSDLLVKAGVSSVRILVPRDTAVRVDTANGLVGTDIGAPFEKVGGVWQTPGYSSASKSWNIRTEAGVGTVSIATY